MSSNNSRYMKMPKPALGAPYDNRDASFLPPNRDAFDVLDTYIRQALLSSARFTPFSYGMYDYEDNWISYAATELSLGGAFPVGAYGVGLDGYYYVGFLGMSQLTMETIDYGRYEAGSSAFVKGSSSSYDGSVMCALTNDCSVVYKSGSDGGYVGVCGDQCLALSGGFWAVTSPTDNKLIIYDISGGQTTDLIHTVSTPSIAYDSDGNILLVSSDQTSGDSPTQYVTASGGYSSLVGGPSVPASRALVAYDIPAGMFVVLDRNTYDIYYSPGINGPWTKVAAVDGVPVDTYDMVSASGGLITDGINYWVVDYQSGHRGPTKRWLVNNTQHHFVVYAHGVGVAHNWNANLAFARIANGI